MDVTRICKRIGKCDIFNVALFVPAFRVAETLMLCSSYGLEVSLLWLKIETGNPVSEL